MTDRVRRLLDASVYVLAAMLVLAIISFAIYYYLDRRVNPGPSLIERETARLEEAVRTQPDSLPARVALARTYELANRYEDAATQYEAVLSLRPENVDALLGAARVQMGLGNDDAALTFLQQVVDLRKGGEFARVDLQLQEAYYYLGEIYLAQQRYPEAIEELKQAVAIDKTDADAWNKLCQAYVESGNNEEAIESCQRAVLLVPDFTEAYQHLAQAYRGTGQALQARYAAAMVLYSTGEHAQAIAELEAVLEEDPEYWEAYVGLGLAQEAKGHREEAIKAYQRALAGDPDSFLARLGLNRLGGTAP